MIRLQFDGSSRAEAADFCAEAVERLKEYVPVQDHMTTRLSTAKFNPEEPGPSTQELQVGILNDLLDTVYTFISAYQESRESLSSVVLIL